MELAQVLSSLSGQVSLIVSLPIVASMIDFEVIERASAQCFQASFDLTPLILLVLIALDIVLPGLGDLLAVYLAVDSFINLSRCPPPPYVLAD